MTLAWRHLPLQIDIVGLLGPYIEQGGLLLLLLSILLGYLLLSFFFYDTNKQHQARQVWDSLHSYWQTLSAILLGGFVFLVFWYAFYPFLSYLQVQMAPEISVDPMKWWLAVSAVIVLLTFFLRWEVGQPVYSKPGLERMQTIINSNAFVWGPVYGIFFAVVVTMSSFFLYPTTGPTPLLFWFYLLPRALFFVLGVWSILWVYYAICAFSSPVQKPSATMRSLVGKFSKIVRHRLSWSGLPKRPLFRSPSRVVVGLGIIILLAILTPLADAQLGLVTPKIAYVETQLNESYDVVGHVDNYSVLIYVRKTLFITAPILLRETSTMILNPSNRSYSEEQSFSQMSWQLRGDKGQVVPVKSPDGRIVAFYVTMNSGTGGRIVLELSYYDKLSYPLINVTCRPDIDVGNDTMRREIQVTIRNTLSKRVDLQQLLLTDTPGNITRVTCTKNGEPSNCTDLDMSARYVYLKPLSIDPRESQTVLVVIEYKRQ